MRAARSNGRCFIARRRRQTGSTNSKALPPGDYFIRADKDIIRRITVVGDARAEHRHTVSAIVRTGGRRRRCGADRRRERICQRQFTGDGFDTQRRVDRRLRSVRAHGYRAGRDRADRVQARLRAPPPEDDLLRPEHEPDDCVAEERWRRSKVSREAAPFHAASRSRKAFRAANTPMDLWIPLERKGECHLPSALIGTTFQIARFRGEPIVIEHSDGQPFELQ